MDDEELLRRLKELEIILPLHKDSDERTTPDNLFKPLDEEFHFTLDPCSTHENAKCKRHYTREENGLLQSWRDEIVFMNPPYSNIHAWLNKARWDGHRDNVTVICILPCDTSTKWFHDYLWDGCNHRPQLGVQLRFPKGRFKFGKYITSPQFATIISVFYPQSYISKILEKAVNHPNAFYAAMKDDLAR